MRIERIQIDITVVNDGILETVDITERREVLEVIPVPGPVEIDLILADPKVLEELLAGYVDVVAPDPEVLARKVMDEFRAGLEEFDWQGNAGDRLNELLNQKQTEDRVHRRGQVEPLKLHNPNTLIKYVRHPDTGKAIGCVVGVQDWDGTTKVGWSQVNPVDMFDDEGRPVKFNKQEAVVRALDRAWSGAADKSPATVKVDNSYGGPSRADLFTHEIEIMRQRAKKYFWMPVQEVVAHCYECSIN